jgi:Tol biopolymer transport system component
VAQLAPTGAPFNFFGEVQVPVLTFAASLNGTLVFSWDSPYRTAGLFWLDREGNETPITEEPGSYIYPTLSPDGKRLSVSHHGQVWIYELGEDGRRMRLTQEGSSIVSLFTPDATRIAFGSYQPDENLYWMAADGGAMELLLEEENRQYPLDWDAAGNLLVLQWTDPRSGYDIWTLTLDGDREARPLLNSPHNERWAQLSPDGRWMTYASDESGRYEIYVVTFPGLRGKRAVSIDGGIEPRWSPRGDEIFFKAGGEGDLNRAHSTLMVASVTGDATLAFGTPRMLFEGDYIVGACCAHSYDVAPDGARFVMTKGRPESKRRLNVLLNAFGGLEER